MSLSDHRLPSQDLPVQLGSLQCPSKIHSNGQALLGGSAYFCLSPAKAFAGSGSLAGDGLPRSRAPRERQGEGGCRAPALPDWSCRELRQHPGFRQGRIPLPERTSCSGACPFLILPCFLCISSSPAHQFVTQGLSPLSRAASSGWDLPGEQTLLPLPCTHQARSIPTRPASCHLPFHLAAAQRMRREGREGTPGPCQPTQATSTERDARMENSPS